MKLLLVAFQPPGAMSYPHLEQVYTHLAGQGADFRLFRERGYFIGDAWPRSLRALAEWGHGWATTCIDTLRLFFTRMGSPKPDLVVAVDNFAFAVASLLFPRVVLWSHDFLTSDEPRSDSFIQRWLSGRLRRGLLEHRALVIQDSERLEVFARTYLREGEREKLEVFLLPVSVRGPGEEPRPIAAGARPVLLQIGGISAARSRSDQLLEDYQRNHEHYELALHGFFDRGMSARVAAAERLPWISAIPLAARDVGRAVRKCDIGVVSYNAANDNFFHIARASGQLAEFTRGGKPVIALGRSNLQRVLPAEGFGIAIERIEELLPALREVQARYDEFSTRAREAFERTYDLDRHLPGLDAWLSARAGGKT